MFYKAQVRHLYIICKARTEFFCYQASTIGQAIQELSKDKVSMKQVENHTESFLKTLETVEIRLSEQIGYLTQVSTGLFCFTLCSPSSYSVLLSI